MARFYRRHSYRGGKSPAEIVGRLRAAPASTNPIAPKSLHQSCRPYRAHPAPQHRAHSTRTRPSQSAGRSPQDAASADVAVRRRRQSGRPDPGGYLLDVFPGMTPTFPRFEVSGHAGAVQFARELRIGFTNNQAERDVRPAKTQLNPSGYHRASSGAQACLRIPGYISTMRKTVSPSSPDSATPSPETPGLLPQPQWLRSRSGIG